MTADICFESGRCEEIQLLTFTIMGTRMGVDTSQVSEMMDFEQAAANGVTVRRFDDEVAFRDGTVTYKFPKVLLIKKEGASRGIVIDQPDEICSVPLGSIRPLPPIISSCKGLKAIWGVALMDEGVVMLVDFYRLD